MDNNDNANSTDAKASIESSADGAIHKVSDADFIAEVLETDTPVLVDFWATWCGPCKFMGPIFEELAPEYQGKVKFAKLDVDENPMVSGSLQIQSIPTFMLISGHTVYAQGVGAMPPDALRRWIDEALEYMDTAKAEEASSQS
jgi:thioredoxin 1